VSEYDSKRDNAKRILQLNSTQLLRAPKTGAVTLITEGFERNMYTMLLLGIKRKVCMPASRNGRILAVLFARCSLLGGVFYSD